MSIFDLHSQVLADYRDFVRSFFTVADDREKEKEKGSNLLLRVVGIC